MDPFFIKVIFAGIVGGASIALMGTVIVGMRIPFLGMYISHGAMVGAVFGSLLGFSEVPSALVGALGSALILGSMTPTDFKQGENVAVGILFSISMGLVFLGMGLAQEGRSEMLSLMWGNLLFTTMRSLFVICAISVVLVLFFVVFAKEIRAIVFSRVLAAASGISETFIWVLFLVLSGLIITFNLRIVGGLMIYALMTNPPAAAFRLCRGFTKAAVLSSIFGAASGLGGFLISYYLSIHMKFDAPLGACIALFSAAIYIAAVLIQRYIIRWD